MLQTARFLIFVTLLYNLAEGALAVWAGVRAGSLSLLAFSADSYLEVAAASVVLWRLGISDPERGEIIEGRAVRFIGWTFLILAAALVFESVSALFNGNGAETSIVGIGLAAASVTAMPLIALAKLRVAANHNLLVLAAEAKESLACSYLSATLLLGLVINALAGWWWIDAATTLLLTPWLIREGLEGVQGEDEDTHVQLCSCPGCLFGLRTCRRACCTGA